jgi:hypothetical protein
MTGGFEEAYFVFGEEDEIAVRICAETAFLRCRPEAMERFQSSLVIVLKTASFGRAWELPALDTGRETGEGVFLHGSLMAREPSRRVPREST